MKKINILTKSIYNRIAAGEVIDRPCSAVKELIDNSIDSGATEIEITVERGGKQLIKVADNGCGIDRDDMRAAFFPHATSKIASVDDLDKITTLGFRGEALASISVISRVELISVTDNNPAYSVQCTDGNIGPVEPAALEKGTEVYVRDLFYNTPVRAKFLKPDKKEEADITNCVTRYILGNPTISFRYFVDGKLILQSHGGGLDEALAQMYGAKIIPQCFKINAQKDDIVIRGYIGNQNFFKPNKTYQSLFINGRYIINSTIGTAISNAYASYAMKRQYPFYVLFIDVPTDFIDVNVHPNKMDVRFVSNQKIFGVIYSVISAVLDGTATAAQFVTDNLRLPEIKSTLNKNPNVVYNSNDARNHYNFNASGDTAKQASVNEQLKPKPVSFTYSPAKPSRYPSLIEEEQVKYYDPILNEPLRRLVPDEEPFKLVVTNDTMSNGFLDGDTRIDEAHKRRLYEQQMIEYESCKYKGNLFNTYLIYEVKDTVYLIDQHAAHERLIYDSLRENISKRYIERQGLLAPYLFRVNPQEKQFIESNIMLIRSLGFDLKPFGLGAYRVDEVPVDLKYLNVEEFFNELLSDMKEYEEIKLEDILKDKIAMTACKHAIKGGKKLTDSEIDALFKMLNGNMGLKCPHGRPICVTLTKTDIEKMFKRIV